MELDQQVAIKGRTFRAVRALAAPGDRVECAAAFADAASACE